jgi:hypothetical protein
MSRQRARLGQQILLRLEISLCAKSVGADPQIVQLPARSSEQRSTWARNYRKSYGNLINRFIKHFDIGPKHGRLNG